MFYTCYDKPKNIFEPKNSGQIIVEIAGYVPAKTLIEGMMYAGRSLDDYRNSQGYDSDEEAFENYDPTTDPDYDLVDAHNDMMRVSESLRKQSEAVPEKPEMVPEKPEVVPENNGPDKA